MSQNYQYNTIEEALRDLKEGKIVLVTDDPDRENEGDLICAAEFATRENINFMATYAKGLICTPMSAEIAARLNFPPMVAENTDNHSTAFTVAVDHADTTTGISAAERSYTIMKCVDDQSKPEDFRRPGHVFPLISRKGGVLVRNGHTEATTDLMRLAGLKECGVCCEVMKEDGTMMRTSQLWEMAKEHNLTFITIRDLQDYIRIHEKHVKEEAVANLPTQYGDFKMYGYINDITGEHHLALVKGDLGDGEDVLCRVHSECLTGDAFGSLRCDCGLQLQTAMRQVEAEGRGIILYMRQEGRGIGLLNKIKAYALQEQGYEAYSLKGGYVGWLMADMKKKEADDVCEHVELSIRKKFKKKIWSKFTKAVREYELVKEGDRIAVCISGGKDSMLMAKLFQELKRHNKFNFEVKFLVMDPGYSPENRKVIEENARKMKIPIQIFESNIFESVFEIEKSPCYICARMRRGYLYNFAQQMGCNKIALGHHYDDVIETILMGMLYSAQVQTMMPKLHSTNFEGMELILPLYFVLEDDIKAWRDYNDLHFIQCACKFTDTCTTCNNEENQSKRVEIKELIKRLKQVNPYVEGNIFKSIENVNLSTVIAYKKDGVKHSFLEEYDD